MVALNNYEGMLLLDNRFAAREWTECEADVSAMLAKHGGSVVRARRWGERKLAYEIRGQKRATYMLVYFQMPPASISPLLRDLELSEHVLRNLIQYRDPEQMQQLLEQDAADAERQALGPEGGEGSPAVVDRDDDAVVVRRRRDFADQIDEEQVAEED